MEVQNTHVLHKIYMPLFFYGDLSSEINKKTNKAKRHMWNSWVVPAHETNHGTLT